MCPQGLSLLPVFLVIWSSATFIVSYLIAIYRNDVDVIFPYISDTSATPPESCIFGLMTFISACAGTATVYAQFKYVQRLNNGAHVLRPRLNEAALAFGVLSCFGMVVVATFQETAVTVAHDVGALLFFVCGIVYTVLQTVVSYQARPVGSSVAVRRARLALVVVSALAFVIAVVCVTFVKKTSLHRFRDDEDYPFHIASAVCEWIVSFSFIFFFFTFIDDFKLFTLRVRTELQE